MNTLSPLPLNEFQNKATQKKSIQRATCIGLSSETLFAVQPKSSQLRVRTKNPLYTYQFHLTAENTLLCKENGRTIPLTPQGVPDLEQLVQQIALRKW